MASNKRIKQWKSFDFGSPVKHNSVIDVLKENGNYKDSSTKKTFKNKPNQTFNFHKELTPKSIADLAVHPRKIKEVEEWFKMSVCQSKPSCPNFLLLTGPTGCGKTATVSVICKTLNISISEWVNPIDQEYEYRGMNQIGQFLDFLSESKYDSLFEDSRKKITLIKDFPNAVIQKPDQFFEILETCKYKTGQPVIFICTEANSTNLNLQRILFPDEIMRKFAISHISFNACAASLMKIAFKRAQEVVKSNPEVFKQPSLKTVDAILASADGDIRNAMNHFHMATLLGCEDLPTRQLNSEGNSAKRKRSKGEVKLKGMLKDQSLGLFHGLGRVLNPKRKLVGETWRLSHNIDSLVDEFSTQPQLFISFLFENYLKYFGDMTEVSKSAEILSFSETFFENWEKPETLAFALWISILGLMVFNENKVSKWTQIRAPIKINKIQNSKEMDSAVLLHPKDYFYYNLINSSDKYHRFKFNF